MSRFLTTPLLAIVLFGCNGDKAFITSNIPPAVTIDSPENGAEFAAGVPVEIQGRVRDEQNYADLVIEWESSRDGVLVDNDPPNPDGLVEVIASFSPGIHVVTLRATDAGGEQAEDTVEFEILQSADVPSITILNPNPVAQPPVNGISGVPFAFLAQVSDASDQPSELSVQVDAAPGGFLCSMQPDGSGNGNCAAVLTIGVYQLTFTVVDTDGFSASAITTFNVRDPLDSDQDGDGHTPNGGDCNDSASTIYPGAPEVCDGLDNDCNPNTAVDVNSPCYDDDGDNYCEAPPCTNATQTIPDCNDANPAIRPLGTELCNGVDDNCDGQTDEGLGAVAYWLDGDSDTWGSGLPVSSCDGPPAAHVDRGGDCDDSNPGVNPGSTEIQNGVDDNCNNQIDEAGPNYDDDGDGYCESPPCTNASGTQSDCDDANGAVHPNAPENCADSVDNNCDGLSNEQNALGCTNYYADGDLDGFGSGTNSQCWCEPQYPYTATTANDCNDNNALVRPNQTAFFNAAANGSFDYNCDGASSPRWSTGSSGCTVAGLGCNGSDGWLGGGIPQCGQSQAYQDDCGLDIGALLLGCGSSCAGDCIFGFTGVGCVTCVLGACPSSQICEADNSGRIQECR